MNQKAPIVNEAFIQAREQEREQAARQRKVAASTSRSAVDSRKEPAVQAAMSRSREPASAARNRLHADLDQSMETSFSASVSPTLTVEVARPPVVGRERPSGPAHLPPRPAPKVQATPAARPATKQRVKKTMPAANKKVRQLTAPKKGFLRSAWEIGFGAIMGINVGVALVYSGLGIYSAIAGKTWNWIPFK